MQFEQDTSSLYLLDAGNHASKSYFSAAALYDRGASAVNKEKVFFFLCSFSGKKCCFIHY